MQESFVTTLLDTLNSVFKGDPKKTELVVIALLAGGHVLLEDIPGVGKTTIAKTLARAIDGVFARIQGTTDMMPSDILGVSIYNEVEKKFEFHKGPVFSSVLIADELNRMPPRTQSALLEAMNEGQVSIDGKTMMLPDNFFCIATQNPNHQIGTYPLPESQRDRFLMKFSLGYPAEKHELSLLKSDGADKSFEKITAVINHSELSELRASIRDIAISDDVQKYLLAIIQATRNCAEISLGASVRASLGLQRAVQAKAFLAGRDFVTPDDVSSLAVAVLSHRITTVQSREPKMVIESLLQTINIPR